jgi:molybdenum cofactor cytidylyltransferase
MTTVASPRVFAIVPAAGRARRMGTAKQLLDVGGRTMLEAVLDPLASVSIAGVAVVLHSGLADQIDLTGVPGAFIARNDDENSEMIDSVRIGLRAWQQRTALGDDDGFLILPADHPGVAAADIEACLAAYRRTPTRIVIATRAGRRGHPLVFGACYVSVVQADLCDSGLNQLSRAHANAVELVACESVGVTRDIDTPADWDRLRS